MPLVNGGIITSAIAILAYSSMVKPLLAKITSPRIKESPKTFNCPSSPGTR